MTLAEKIKLKGLELGYAAVGIGPADKFAEYIDILKERHDKYDFYISRPWKVRTRKSSVPGLSPSYPLPGIIPFWTFPKNSWER